MGAGQGRCEQRSEVFVKIQKKKCFFFLGGGEGWGQVGTGLGGQGRCNREVNSLGRGVGSGVGLGGQGGCERRIKVFKKNRGGGGGQGVRVGGGCSGWGGSGWL